MALNRRHIKKIRKYIGKAELEKAVDKLAKSAKKLDLDQQNRIYIISMQYFSMQRNFLYGFIDWDAKKREENFIASCILEFLGNSGQSAGTS